MHGTHVLGKAVSLVLLYLKAFSSGVSIFAMRVHGIVDELGVITELLEGGDGRQHPGRHLLVLSLQQLLGCI